MLLGLTIRDVVLIERLSLAFRPGLCVLTGETGAGKSPNCLCSLMSLSGTMYIVLTSRPVWS